MEAVGFYAKSVLRIRVALRRHGNLAGVHDSWRSRPVRALEVADRAWTIGDVLDAALATRPSSTVTTVRIGGTISRILKA
jgi:hypothetical protein